MTIPAEQLVREASRLDQIYLHFMSAEQTRDVRVLLAGSDLPPEVAVRSLGEALWDTILDADAGLRDAVLKRLGSRDRLRLVVGLRDLAGGRCRRTDSSAQARIREPAQRGVEGKFG